MAVYDGVPSIRLEGDEKRALALIPEAKALLQTVQTFKNRAGVGTFSMSHLVNEDSTIYVLSAGAQNILQITVAPQIPETINEEFEEPTAKLHPDFYSGMVFRGLIVQQEVDGENVSMCDSFAPTPNCAATHDEVRMGRQQVVRLAVEPYSAYTMELSNSSSSGIPIFSQYTKLRSSMYSGRMKKVVQVVMGLGRIGKPKMRNQKKREPDSKYIDDVGARGVQVRYDWRFNRTHGIHVGADGAMWLVEISQTRGVIARILPMFPNSTTDNFRNKSESRGDTAMVTALDELKGLPTGEAFPGTGAGISDLIESGDIIRLAEASDLAEFYKCSPYSSSMGWSFNDPGTEAHNTAYYFGEDGFQRGVWYQLNISIGAVNSERVPGQPVASGSAVLVMNKEGFIYCPPSVRGVGRYVPMKYHEPMLPGLMSHEGVPSIEAAGRPVPKVDTPMFVTFVDEQLKVVSYYRNPKADTFNNVDDPRGANECILAGSWTITRTSGSRSFPPMMYTNDFDDRRVTQEHTEVTEITSEDLGYDPPKFTDFLMSPETSYVWRDRVFRRTTVVDRRGGEYIVAAVAVPEYSREAYYYATANRYSLERSGTTAVEYEIMKDPNVGYAWRCFPRINAPPFPPNRPDCNTRVCRGDAGCTSGGVGFPKERRVVCLAHEPSSDCYAFADSGPWLELCDIVDGFNSPGMDKTPSFESWNLGSDEHAKLYLVSNGHGGPVTVPVTPSQVFNHWMTPSPDPETLIVQFIYATHSAIGADALIYATGLSSYGAAAANIGYFPEPISDSDGYPAFVGVNQP